MKLIEFNPENSIQQNPGAATIRVNRKAGLISFSKHACAIMKLKPGMKLLIYQEQDNPTSWYIRISSAGFPIRTSNNIAFDFNNKTISNKILDSAVRESSLDNPIEYQKPLGACGFYISETETVIDGIKYFPFSTSKILGAK